MVLVRTNSFLRPINKNQAIRLQYYVHRHAPVSTGTEASTPSSCQKGDLVCLTYSSLLRFKRIWVHPSPYAKLPPSWAGILSGLKVLQFDVISYFEGCTLIVPTVDLTHWAFYTAHTPMAINVRLIFFPRKFFIADTMTVEKSINLLLTQLLSRNLKY